MLVILHGVDHAYLALHQPVNYLTPCLEFGQRNVESFDQPSSGCLVKVLGPVCGSHDQDPLFSLSSGAVLETQSISIQNGSF